MKSLKIKELDKIILTKTRFCDELEEKSDDMRKEIKASELRSEKLEDENENLKENQIKNDNQANLNRSKILELDEKIKYLNSIILTKH